MKVAVITPYYREGLETLERCMESVAKQGVNAVHILVSDGHPNDYLNTRDVLHIENRIHFSDNGNTPRAMGAMAAVSMEVDFIAFLDADNWFMENHLTNMIDSCNKTHADIMTCKRVFYCLKGFEMNYKERMEDEYLHVDTSCFLFHRYAFKHVTVWSQIPAPLSTIGDRVFLQYLIHQRCRIRSTGRHSVAFSSQYLGHYLNARMDVSKYPNLKGPEEFDEAVKYLKKRKGKMECVRRLGFILTVEAAFKGLVPIEVVKE